jgi:predicted RNA-binding Zn ribbon-like protein
MSGSATRSGPTPRLAQVIEFTNTVDIASGEDDFVAASGLQTWLADRGLRRASVTPKELGRAIVVREGIRALASANAGEPLNVQAIADLDRVSDRFALRPRVLGEDTVLLESLDEGVDGFLAMLLLAIHDATLDASWERVKACRNDECRWLFYDRSRNRSGAWCDMAVCGNLMKARAYRSRKTKGYR